MEERKRSEAAEAAIVAANGTPLIVFRDGLKYFSGSNIGRARLTGPSGNGEFNGHSISGSVETHQLGR